MTTSRTFNSSWWRFLVPLGLQLGIILIVPAQSAYTYNFGQSAVLQTLPVDPYDLLRGYSQTLSYDISQINNLKVSNKTWRSGGFETCLSLLYLRCININFSSSFMATTPSSILLCVSLPCSNFSQDSNNNAVLIIFYCYKLDIVLLKCKTLKSNANAKEIFIWYGLYFGDIPIKSPATNYSVRKVHFTQWA